MKRIVYQVVVVVIVLLALSACSGEAAKNSDDRNNPISKESLAARERENMKAWAKVDAEKQQLRQALGEDSIYPDFYAGVEEHKITGKTEREAVNATKASTLEREAQYWYAIEHGIKLSDKEAKEKLEERIKEIKLASGYAETDEDYKSAGTTLEAVMRADCGIYKKRDTIDAFYLKTMGQYKRGDLTDEEVLDWDKYWNKFTQKVIADYQKTDACRQLERVMQNSAKLVPAGMKDIEKIKAGGTEL